MSINFLLQVNQKFLSIYQKEGKAKSSDNLIKILEKIFPEYSPADDDYKKFWNTTWNSDTSIDKFSLRENIVQENAVMPPPQNSYISIPKLIKILTERKIFISPFTFWSFIFAKKHDDRDNIIFKLLSLYYNTKNNVVKEKLI